LARVLVGSLLFVALFVTYLAAFPEDLDIRDPSLVQARLSQFGRDFALAFLLVQATIVLLVTPLFVASGIVEETERRTLEFLLATDLSAREIILGKLWPRLLLVLCLVMAGWPVLAITQVWGGVDVVHVAMASLVIVAEMWVVAGISSACAVGAKTLRKALVRSYAWSLLALTLPVCSCPFGMIVLFAEAGDGNPFAKVRGQPAPGGTPAPPPSSIAVYGPFIGALLIHIAVQILVGLWGVRRATYKLRHARYFYAAMPWQQRPARPKHWEKHPPVPQGSPLVWKEIHLSGQTNRFVRSLGLVPWWLWLSVSTVFMVVGLVLVMDAIETNDVFATLNEMVRWGGAIMVGLMALVVGLHAAGTVARERQQETLNNLLVVPRPRREILWAKWVGSLAKARGIALGALAIPLVGVISQGISIWAVVPLTLAAGSFVACAASFGLFLSVNSRTVQRGTFLWLLLVGVWVGGTFLAAQAAYADQRTQARTARGFIDEEPETLVWDRMLNPVLAWSELTFEIRDEKRLRYYWDEWRDGEVDEAWQVFPSLFGVLLHAILAWALYVAAVSRFEREGRK
jgi:ABC-type transport system involved in multi-copper enzyme maturation permease subunit